MGYNRFVEQEEKPREQVSAQLQSALQKVQDNTNFVIGELGKLKAGQKLDFYLLKEQIGYSRGGQRFVGGIIESVGEARQLIQNETTAQNKVALEDFSKRLENIEAAIKDALFRNSVATVYKSRVGDEENILKAKSELAGFADRLNSNLPFPIESASLQTETRMGTPGLDFVPTVTGENALTQVKERTRENFDVSVFVPMDYRRDFRVKPDDEKKARELVYMRGISNLLTLHGMEQQTAQQIAKKMLDGTALSASEFGEVRPILKEVYTKLEQNGQKLQVVGKASMEVLNPDVYYFREDLSNMGAEEKKGYLAQVKKNDRKAFDEYTEMLRLYERQKGSNDRLALERAAVTAKGIVDLYRKFNVDITGMVETKGEHVDTSVHDMYEMLAKNSQKAATELLVYNDKGVLDLKKSILDFEKTGAGSFGQFVLNKGKFREMNAFLARHKATGKNSYLDLNRGAEVGLVADVTLQLSTIEGPIEASKEGNSVDFRIGLSVKDNGAIDRTGAQFANNFTLKAWLEDEAGNRTEIGQDAIKRPQLDGKSGTVSFSTPGSGSYALKMQASYKNAFGETITTPEASVQVVSKSSARLIAHTAIDDIARIGIMTARIDLDASNKRTLEAPLGNIHSNPKFTYVIAEWDAKAGTLELFDESHDPDSKSFAQAIVKSGGAGERRDVVLDGVTIGQAVTDRNGKGVYLKMDIGNPMVQAALRERGVLLERIGDEMGVANIDLNKFRADAIVRIDAYWERQEAQ